MTNARRAIAGIVAGVAATAISFAPGASAAKVEQNFVTVTNQGGVVHIGTAIPGQPLLGASIDTNTGKLCLGFSYQVPFCTSIIAPSTAAVAPSPVYVDTDASDGSVGAGVLIGTGYPIVGVSYSTITGQLCAGVGMQRPFCVQLT